MPSHSPDIPTFLLPPFSPAQSFNFNIVTIHNTSGVNGQNTQWWIANSSGLDGDQVIIAWIHSHVQGMQCCFSSIDVHSQHAMQMMYPGSFGIVMEVKKCSEIGKTDAFVLTDHGLARVLSCNLNNLSHSGAQHESCSRSDLYQSIWASIAFTNQPIEVLDFMEQPEGTYFTILPIFELKLQFDH